MHANASETEEYIKRLLTRYGKNEYIPWAIVYKPENKVIGLFSLFSYIPSNERAEIGYAIARSYWGKGFATEATKAVVGFGFTKLGLHRMQATFDPENIASRRVLEKNGFEYEGRLRDYYKIRNTFFDRLMFAKINAESSHN